MSNCLITEDSCRPAFRIVFSFYYGTSSL